MHGGLGARGDSGSVRDRVRAFQPAAYPPITRLTQQCDRNSCFATHPKQDKGRQDQDHNNCVASIRLQLRIIQEAMGKPAPQPKALRQRLIVMEPQDRNGAPADA
jgi:hypothetical protein